LRNSSIFKMKWENPMRRYCAAIGALAALAALFAAARADASYVSTVEGIPNLLAYYRFSSLVGNATGTFAVSEVGSTSGKLQNGASTSLSGPFLTGGPSVALVLSNHPGTQYVSTDLSGGVTTEGTILAWVNLSREPSAAGRIFYIAGEAQVGNDLDLQIDQNDATRFYTANGSSVAYTTPLVGGAWEFLAAVYKSGERREIYLNGQLVASDTPDSTSAVKGAFNIGDSAVSTGRYFDGGIDEVALYNRALSSSEIAGVYASAVPEPASLGLLGSGVLAFAAIGVFRRRLLSRGARQ
jgi:hypothetical protein